MENERIHIGGFQIARILYDFVNGEVLPGTNIDVDSFWLGAVTIIEEFSARNRRLLQKRDDLQAKIDAWHRAHPHGYKDIATYKAFLLDIGYLSFEKDNDKFHISTTNVDEEIARKAGPQLVVPLMNARFALNAANARWGSLYDALYGTDAISESDGCERTHQYNLKRGEKVVVFTRRFLDQAIPLVNGLSHRNAVKYSIFEKALQVSDDWGSGLERGNTCE